MIEKGKTYAGGCLCGSVRYELRGPSVAESHCCCTDCQKVTGTGHATLICIHRSQLSVSGELAQFSVVATSGGDTTRHFCPKCASRIFSSGTKPGEMWMVQAGTLDESDAVEPDSAIYHSQAVRWDSFGPAVTLYDKMGPYSDAVRAAMSGDLSYFEASDPA